MFDALQRHFDDTVAAVRDYAAALDLVAEELAESPDRQSLIDELGGRPSDDPE
jgi:hypothetical protein